MITEDYNRGVLISREELQDLQQISNVKISSITLEEHPNLLVFPDSWDQYDRDFRNKVICNVAQDEEGHKLHTNSIVGFVGRNGTHLSIHSRFAKGGNSKQDCFLHYMLQRVAQISLFHLNHPTDQDDGFDFLIYLFPNLLNKAISQGVYKKYVTRRYNDANVRGVIDINRHIRYNEPFNGRVSYTTREFSYDNELTQLIRHTIEYIARRRDGSNILSADPNTKQAVQQIISATPSYQPSRRLAIVNKNLRPLVHPYYSDYAPLQKLCLQILRHDELKYGHAKDEIYGVLIDAAWLWEEYLAIVLKGKLQHLRMNDTSKYYLFEEGSSPRQQIIPDYLSPNKDVVADAKYIPLDERVLYEEESVTAVYYKTIAYMYRFCSKNGYLLYPSKSDNKATVKTLQSEKAGVNGGTITEVGLKIPTDVKDFDDFCSKMQEKEKTFLGFI